MADRIERRTKIAENAAKVAESRLSHGRDTGRGHSRPAGRVRQGAPSRERYERIAREWQNKDAARFDREWREASGLPPWPAPAPPTAASLGEEIRELRAEWLNETDGQFDPLVSGWTLGLWWDTARVVWEQAR